MISNYSEFAFNIVNNLLHVQKDNVISISAEIHNRPAAEDPLVEIPLLEEIAVAIRKKKAFPVLEISTENLKKRFFTEMPEDVFSAPPTYYQCWIDSIDTFIEVGWESLDSDYKETADQQINTFKKTTRKLINQLFQKKKKLVFLNYPTRELAGFIQADFEELKSTYLKAANCNYSYLRTCGSDLRENFYPFRTFKIKSKNEELEFRVIKDRIELFDGDSAKNQVIVIPTGIMEIPINRSSLNGIFLADKVYYCDKTYDNVKIKFENGTIRYVAFSTDVKGNFYLQSELMNSIEECYLTIGFNREIRHFTNFFSYDRCIDGNVSLKFFDRNNKHIFMSSMLAEIDRKP
jgi:leucyl aminopeptidase (aminopeptidase T)